MKKLAALILILILSSTAQAEEPIKIAVLTDLTGLGSYWGVQTRLGADIAEEELNKEGTQVEVIIEDHKLKASTAVSATQKVIHADKVDAVYSEFTVTVPPTSPIAKNAKKLFLGSCAANSFLDTNPYAFKSYVNYQEGCKSIAEYWKKQGIKNPGMLKAEFEYGELCYQGMKDVYPKIISTEYKFGEAVNTQALVLKNKNVDAVINVALESDLLTMMQAFAGIDYHPWIASNFDAVTKNLINKFPNEESKIISFGFKNVSPEFIGKVKEADPSNTLVSIEGAAQAYLHVRQMVGAIKACKRNDVECQVKKMAASGSDKGKVISFEEFKNREAVFTVGLKKWSNGKEVLVR